MQRYAIIIMLMSGSLLSQSQDVHFSQYYSSHMMLNPAMTGVFNGKIRVCGNYRNQWQSIIPENPYRTFAGALDFSLRSGEYNHFGIGMNVFRDVAGTSELSLTHFSTSLAYNLSISGNEEYHLVAGIQAAMAQQTINYFNLTFGSQYVNNEYDPNNPTGENFGEDNHNYLDAGAGILWYHVRDIRNNQYIGFSVWHVNRPDLTFLNTQSDNLYIKYLLHTGVQFGIGDQVDLLPMAMAMVQGPAFETNAGLLVKFSIERNKASSFGGTAIYFGPLYRLVGDNYRKANHDALIITSKLDLDNFTFGVSYDMNISGLSPATNGRGGLEISLQYIVDWKETARPNVYCPKF